MKWKEKLRLWWGLPLLCKMGTHDWRNGPCSECCECGYPDTFFDGELVASARMEGWRMERRPSYSDRIYDEAPETPLSDEQIEEYIRVAMREAPND